MLFCAAGATVSIGIRLLLLATLHATRARNMMREAVSDYGVGPTRSRFELMATAATVGWWLTAATAWTAYPTWTDRGPVAIGLGVVGLTTALMRFFPTDLPGESLTSRGRIHYALAITQFALTYALMGNVCRLLADPVLQLLQVVALAGLVGLSVLLIPTLRRRFGLFGLFERIFLVSGALFYLHFCVVTALHHT